MVAFSFYFFLENYWNGSTPTVLPINLTIPYTDTIIAMPTTPQSICICPVLRAAGSSPWRIRPNTPQTKTRIVKKKKAVTSGLTITLTILSIRGRATGLLATFEKGPSALAICAKNSMCISLELRLVVEEWSSY